MGLKISFRLFLPTQWYCTNVNLLSKNTMMYTKKKDIKSNVFFFFRNRLQQRKQTKKKQKTKNKNNLQNYSEICPKKKNPSFFLFLFFSSSLKASKTQSVKKTKRLFLY